MARFLVGQRGVSWWWGVVLHVCTDSFLCFFALSSFPCLVHLSSSLVSLMLQFYGGLMAMMMMLLSLFIFFYLHDGIVVGKKWQPRTGDLNCCQKCTQRCGDGVRQSMSQGFQIEKFKIALGLFQVFSSFKMTVSTAMAVVAATKTIVSYVCSMCFLVTEFFFFSFSVVSLYHSTKSIGHRK